MGAKHFAIFPKMPRDDSYWLMEIEHCLSLKQNRLRPGTALATFSDWTMWSVSCDRWVCLANGISALTSLIAIPEMSFESSVCYWKALLIIFGCSQY